MAIPTNFPPQMTPSPAQPAQPSRTSGALVLNINAPLSNYAGDGAVPAPGANPAQGSSPAIGAGPSADTFQRRNNSPFVPNPAASPKEQLEQAYLNALNTRNDSEQARNSYLNLANQLNGQSFQNNQAPQPLPAAPPANNGFQAPPALPAQPQPDAQQFQQQLSQLQQMQQTQLQQQQQQFQQQMQQQQAQIQQLQQQAQSAAAQQQQPALQPQPPIPNQFAQLDPAVQQQLAQQQMMQQMQMQQNPYGQMDPAMQQQLAQQQMMQQAQQQQPQMDPAMQQQLAQQQMMQQQQMAQVQAAQPGQQTFQTMRPEELNQLIANPQASNQKLGAILEFAARQQGTHETFAQLAKEAGQNTAQLPPGQAQDDANLIRQAALFALGNMNRMQTTVPTHQMYGMGTIQQILSNPQENPAVKAAAVTSLGYLDRPKDPVIQNMLKIASKDQNPDVKNAVAQVKAGMLGAGQVPGAAPQGAQAPQPGMPQAS